MSVRTWLSNLRKRPLTPPRGTVASVGTALEIAQLKFLLANAPMMYTEKAYFKRSITKYAYTNPKTLLELVPDATPYYMEFPPSPTCWQFVPLMPEGRVIFSQVPMLCNLKGGN